MQLANPLLLPTGPRRRVAAGALALALACLALASAVNRAAAAPAPPSPVARGLDIDWIDVEGGAASLIVTPGGESILIDSGWPGARDADRIARVARERGLSRIDHLVTTHWHVDHVGGVDALAARLPVGRYYDHGLPASEAPDVDPALMAAYVRITGGHSQVLRPGDTLPLRADAGTTAVSARVVAAAGLVEGETPGAPQTRACPAHPPHEARPDDTSDNFRSVGIVVDYGRFRFVDLGDLTWNVEHKLACPRNLVGKVDVLQVTHHGADISNNPALLMAMAPAVAVIDNGAHKGGTAAVFKRLLGLPVPPDVFELHRNVETGEADNAPPALVANDAEACTGNGIHLSVDRAGSRYSIEVGAKGTRRTYEAK